MSELLRRVQVLWDGLAQREQVLVGFAGVAAGFALLVFGVVMPVMAATESAAARAENAEYELATM